MDTARGAVPAGFVVDGCIDTGEVWIRNNRRVPVLVTRSGDVGPPTTVYDANATLAAGVMWLVHRDRSRLLAPGQTVIFPLGQGPGSVTVSTHIGATNTYVIARAFADLIPGSAFRNAKGANAAAQFVSELTNVFQNYQNCSARATNAIRRTACGALLLRDVGFAATRLGVSLGARLLGVIVTSIKTWDFAARVRGELDRFRSGDRTIALGGSRRPPAHVRGSSP